MNEILLVNPRRRRRKGGKRRKGRARLKRHVSRRRSVRRVKARRYKRNPTGLSVRGITGSIVPTVKAGAMGAVGALANDALFGQLGRFLPAMLTSGYGRHAAKIGSAVLVGTVGNFVLRGKGRDLAVGAATVAIHGLLKEVVATNLPAVAPYLGDYEDVSGYNPGMLVDESAQVGAYVPGMVGDVGEYVPGFVGGGDDDM